ncbi:MAG: hypothetical protein WAT70_05025 [Rhizobiaceae bacterium]|jgi:hypothetical protein
MSYDLYFYRKKGSGPTAAQVRDYLNSKLKAIAAEESQWFYENEDTEVYFSFDQNQPETDPESIDLFESFPDFDNTHFTFNLNFIRPDFFGVEAFAFVDKMVSDLDLFVLDTQSSTNPDNPTKPETGVLYQGWSTLNARHSAHYFEEMELNYLDPEKATQAHQFNSHRSRLQERLGDDYFVPKVFFILPKGEKKVVTVSTWTQHIPCVLPPTDYYILLKKVKKLFKTFEESGLVRSELLFTRFKGSLDEFDFPGCRIIHPRKAAMAKDLFNSTPLELHMQTFGERVDMMKMVTTKP